MFHGRLDSQVVKVFPRPVKSSHFAPLTYEAVPGEEDLCPGLNPDPVHRGWAEGSAPLMGQPDRDLLAEVLVHSLK